MYNTSLILHKEGKDDDLSIQAKKEGESITFKRRRKRQLMIWLVGKQAIGVEKAKSLGMCFVSFHHLQFLRPAVLHCWKHIDWKTRKLVLMLCVWRYQRHS